MRHRPLGAQKRSRQGHGSDSDSKEDKDGQAVNEKRAKKSVKFNETTEVEKDKPRFGILPHLERESAQGPCRPARQQIDWGPPIEHSDPRGWQPPPILGNYDKVYEGNLAWTNATSDFNVKVAVHGFQPELGVFIRLPRTLDIAESISIDEMHLAIEKSGAKPWHLHRAWIVGPTMPNLELNHKQYESLKDDAFHDASSKQRVVGRILVNRDGEVLHNYNEGWTKGCPFGWELFIMEPTASACAGASALLQEGDAARRSHSLLMIAVPHYWGELLPLGENGIRQGLVGSARVYVSASGASTLHKLPKIINCDLKAHRSRMNLKDIWHSVFYEQNIRLYPRQATPLYPRQATPPSNLPLSVQEEASYEANRKNVADFEALEKRLSGSPYGGDALICQHDVPPHLDLALAAPAEKSGFLLLGCWNRKLVPGVGHHAINFRDVRSWFWS